MGRKIVQRLLHDSDQNGMGIINIPDEIKRKGGKAWLTVNAQGKDDVTPSAWHSEFSPEDWEDFKKNLNDNGRGITKVWIDDEEDVEDEEPKEEVEVKEEVKEEPDELDAYTKDLEDYLEKNPKAKDKNYY